MTTKRPSDEVRSALFEQLTERLRTQGLTHPEAAAVALAARGDARLSLESFAEQLGVDPERLRRAENGELSLGEVRELLERVSSERDSGTQGLNND